MQRKVDQYWKRKDNIKERVSAVASKVQRTEEAMSFQEVQLREGRGSVINQAQFIRPVADNMKQRLFTTGIKQSTG